jgi:hypothetical protein
MEKSAAGVATPQAEVAAASSAIARGFKGVLRCALPRSWSFRFPNAGNQRENEGTEMNSAVKLAPSILAADFTRLGEQVAEAERAGADRIHVDVMDGHFVPNLSMGPAIVQSLRSVTLLPLETHLMITNPDLYLDGFAEAIRRMKTAVERFL